MDVIPRRIIQTWKTRNLPKAAERYSKRLKALHPSFEYLFFDDQDVDKFMAEEPRLRRDIFYGFQHKIQRFDYFRYLAIHRLGGFYFDIDVWMDHAVDDLLQFDAVFPFELKNTDKLLQERYNCNDLIGQYAFGALPRHPFLANILAGVERAASDPGWAEVPTVPGDEKLNASRTIFYTTGPVMVTRAYLESTAEVARTVRILTPDDRDDELMWYRFGRYGRHDMEGTWRAPATGVLGFLRSCLKEFRKLKRRVQRHRVGRGFSAVP